MKRERIMVVLLALSSVLGAGTSFSQTPGSDQKGGGRSQAQTADQKKGHPALPSETPSRLEPATDGFDFIRRDVMIPMRDGVRLHTVILVPKGARRAPILL